MKSRANRLKRPLALLAAALVFLQALALFGPPPGREAQARAASAELARLFQVGSGQAIICLDENGPGQGAPVEHRRCGDCPLCAQFGHAAPPPPPAWAPLLRTALVARPEAPLPDHAPAARPRRSAQPRGPPPALAWTRET